MQYPWNIPSLDSIKIRCPLTMHITFRVKQKQRQTLTIMLLNAQTAQKIKTRCCYSFFFDDPLEEVYLSTEKG